MWYISTLRRRDIGGHAQLAVTISANFPAALEKLR